MIDFFRYCRRPSSIARVGNVLMGGSAPIGLQSMTNTSTTDVESSVAQAARIFDAGADCVRFTAQGVRETEALKKIRKALTANGYPGALIADIHFNPKAADAALAAVEKVRINPGNYVDIKGEVEDTPEAFARGAARVAERFGAFVREAKSLGRAIRIGVNHGSLSERMMMRYGDTPVGMVESALEYLRVCRDHSFEDVVVSMKASNVVVMTESVRLIVDRMDAEKMRFPLHLGVTEAGDAEDGRIKSAVGIGSLLADGLGDTIRVSLSEAPENEIPVGRLLRDYIAVRAKSDPVEVPDPALYDRHYCRRAESLVVSGVIGGNLPPVVLSEFGGIVPGANIFEAYADSLDETLFSQLRNDRDAVLLLSSRHDNPVADWRRGCYLLQRARVRCPVILHRTYDTANIDELRIFAAADFGTLLLEGCGSGLAVTTPQLSDSEAATQILFGILQATRLRMTKPDYISCPGCGRTLYDLEETIHRIKAATSHLKGLKIGIMGCIVNGPGEMADADYGYVGAAPGKIDLYKARECVERGIPQAEAVTRLLSLIRAGGDWVDP